MVWNFHSVTVQAQVSFSSDIQPLLSDRCFTCHGPDAGQRETELRLDDEESAKEFAVVPGNPSDSEIMDRIMSDDPDYMMPPPESNLPAFTPQEIKLFESWINDGAKWGKHWSFESIQSIEVPQETEWTRNEIDRFVAAKLKGHKLSNSPLAPANNIARRLAFDITGLPPTKDQVATLSSATDFDSALQQLVDELLASPKYGERMATDWLDVARYSDTYGYQVDRDRRVWPWRDWVVQSFNNNQPYDQFITEQIAGDLLTEPSPDQILATTFSRLHPQKVEGGSVEEEFRIEYVADRTQTFATAFLGLTMECARCHDHKYDPLSQKEYYQLSAFFDNIDESGLYSYFTGSTPTPALDLPNQNQREQQAKFEAQLAELESEIKAIIANPKSSQRFEEFARQQAELETPPTDTTLAPGYQESFELTPDKLGGNKQVDGIAGKAVELTGDNAFNTTYGNFARHEPFSISLWINTPDVKERAVILHRSRAWTDAASRGYQILFEEGKLSWSLIHFWPGNAIRIKTSNAFPTETWTHVTVTYDGSSRADGLKIFVDGKLAETEVIRDNLTREIRGGGGDNIAIGERFRDYGFKGGMVDELQVFANELTPREVHHLHQQVVTDSTPKFELDLATYLSRHDEQYKAKLKELYDLRASYFQLRNQMQQIMVMQELASPRKTFLLNRGAYDQRGEEVLPATPVVLGDYGNRPKNRLGLAQWLTDKSNPLAARVYVNRVWQMMMGEGLVRTPEDFGVQGAQPTHPELLDWLANDFVSHGWDVKRLVKQIATSATYLQSSAVTPEQLELDPENQLLARSFRHRLSAEMLRDNALSVSGLLSDRIGGAPAKPYEVEVSFKPAKRDSGEGLYRRSLYTYWKRTGPAPVMMALDASKRDVCRVKREKTSSPLQAFVLMNNPQFVEAARSLAENCLKQNSDNHQRSIQEIFAALTSREINEQEMKILNELFETQVAFFSANPENAKQFLAVGEKKFDEKLPPNELAALTVVANTLFGFDDAVMKK